MRNLYIGLMSGTSMDGIDGALCSFGDKTEILAHASTPMPDTLRTALLALQYPGPDELHQAAHLGNQLAALYAETVHALLGHTHDRNSVCAIGCHGQTIRHQPNLGYTLQIGNAALLAELTQIDVIADFRSRDIAAGGQGAPLVPAFHAAMFSAITPYLTVANIGGMANLTRLHAGRPVIGFDCGPGNVLMDAWIHQQQGKNFDANGEWAASGQVHGELLQALLAQDYFDAPPPKSCGREQFDLPMLESALKTLTPRPSNADVQATLCELTARSLAEALKRHCPGTHTLMLCGGGARNTHLVERLQRHLPETRICTTDSAGIPADLVEAAAFAWLAQEFMAQRPGNLPAVTGAQGPRILGALHPA